MLSMKKCDRMQVLDMDRHKTKSCNFYIRAYNGMQWWVYNREKLYLSFDLVLNTQLSNYSGDKYLALRLFVLKDI